MKTPLLVRGMWGMGDCIYQRPFIKVAAERYDLYLETPWPDLYHDLNVKFVRAERPLRTQMKNVQRQARSVWTEAPKQIRVARIGYGHAEFRRGTLIDAMRKCLPPPLGHVLKWDLPFNPTSLSFDRPIALVRPVTIRTEWVNTARNPRSEYVVWVSEKLRETHHVILVADLQDGVEWAEGALPPHDTAFVKGELNVTALLELAAAADVIAGPVGWIVPAAIALKRKAFIILGGHGGHNAPEKITDRSMDLSRIGFAMPDHFCRCDNMRHGCDKTISDLDRQWQKWTERVGLSSPMSLPSVA